ncbi:hypothetical protein HK405_004792 [Cladochytrium tenue]|nr:hypothetical protein HK405_004792 [Cladochytrium tenue]
MSSLPPTAAAAVANPQWRAAATATDSVSEPLCDNGVLLPLTGADADLEARIEEEGAENDAAYFLPSDSGERKRLNVQRALFQDTAANALVLDMACGPGSWALEMAIKFPHASFVGGVGWNGPIGNLCAADIRQLATGASRPLFQAGRDDVAYEKLLDAAFQQADPTFAQSAPLFVRDLCKTTPESDSSGASSKKKLLDNDIGMLKAVDFVASDEGQAALKGAASFVHDISLAGTQKDGLSENLQKLLEHVDKVVQLVDDVAEVHIFAKIAWTLAIYGYKV